MARRRGNRSAYFRTYFEEHPDLVDGSDNSALYAQWSRDHSGREMTQKDKQAMANVKSSLRSQHRGGGKRKGRRLLRRVTAAGARTGRSASRGHGGRSDSVPVRRGHRRALRDPSRKVD